MSRVGDGAEDRTLWRRWRASEMTETRAPDALALAAYAEGRLGEAEAGPVEAWLAAHPEVLADIQTARALAPLPSDEAYEAAVARACALVAGDDAPAASNVVPLRRVARSWRDALAWSSVAASLVAASLVGFSMGSDASQSLWHAQTQVTSGVSADLLDASPTLDSAYFSNDSGS